MIHYYPHVPRLGNVALSRHAQEKCRVENITDDQVHATLFNPQQADVREAGGIVLRESNGIRFVIIERPEPFRGAMLVKTIIRLRAQAKAKP